MKRCVIILLAAVLLFTGCDMGVKRTNPAATVQYFFYYLAGDEISYRSDNGPLVAESRTLIGEQLQLHNFLELYFAGPVETGAKLPFSTRLQLKDAVLEDGVLSLQLSYDWNSMYQLDRKLAEICLLRTATQYPGVKQLRVNDVLLKETDYLLVDLAGVDDQFAVKLYYSDMSGRYLMKETRSRESSTAQSLQEFVLNELLIGPENEDYLPALPEGTRLMGVELTQGICTVNFSEEFLNNKPETHTQARVAVFSVVNSLTELSQVESVRLLCAGKEIGSYCGLDLSGVLQRDELVISDAGQNLSVLDATLYIPVTGGKLVPVPVSIPQIVGRTGTESVLNALLSFQTGNGYENPFPAGTLVIKQETKDGLCTVTFNGAFAREPVNTHRRQTAVRSLVTTLCSLGQIDSVRILTNDEDAEAAGFGDILLPQSEWLLQPSSP